MRHLTIHQAIKLTLNSQVVVDIRHHNPGLALREARKHWPDVEWLESPDGIVSVFGCSSADLEGKEAWNILIRPEA